jgi:hypothetical protein
MELYLVPSETNIANLSRLFLLCQQACIKPFILSYSVSCATLYRGCQYERISVLL